MKKRYLFLFVVIVFVVICLCLFNLKNTNTPEVENPYKDKETQAFSDIDSIEYLMKIKNMKELYFSEEEMIKFLAYDYKNADFAEYIEAENKVIIAKSKMNELIIDRFLREIDFAAVQDYIKDEKVEVVLESELDKLDYTLIDTWYVEEGENYISKYKDNSSGRYYELSYMIQNEQTIYVSLREVENKE